MPHVVAASTQQTIAIVIGLLVVVGWALYLVANVRRARPEIGAELELAANRKPYLDDEELEGPKLDRALTWGLVMLAIIGVGLPLYWLAEPGRQEGAIENFETRYGGVSYFHGQPVGGGALFAATSEGGFNCAGCHGGMAGLGGEVPYTLTDPVTDELRQVQWKAPPLNDVVLRMSDDQIRDVLIYGRPFSPMPAWGIEGGGPLNEQQIDNLILYMHQIAISSEEARQQSEEAGQAERDRLAEADGDQEATLGAALFNLHCARCHTLGWSYNEAEEPGSGAMGPPLFNVLNQFPAEEDHIDFVTNGAERGDRYGLNGQSSGRMPYFGRVLTEDQIQAIVRYERALAERKQEASS